MSSHLARTTCLEPGHSLRRTGSHTQPVIKTKAVTFSYSYPRVIFEPSCLSLGMEVTIVDSLKLLGVHVESDLKLDAFVANGRKRGLYASWQLRRLQAQGVNSNHLRTAYIGYVRSTTEYGLLALSPMMSATQWARLEAVQRQATKVCLGIRPLAFGDHIPPYAQRLQQLRLTNLQDRTEKRLQKFTLRNEFEPRFRPYLPRRTQTGRASRLPRPYLQPIPRTERLRSSPFYTMRSFLNTLDSTPEQRRPVRQF